MTKTALQITSLALIVAFTATCRSQTPKPQALFPPPPRKGFVNDYSNLLDKTSADKIDATLAHLSDTSKIEFAVLIVDSIGERSLEDYSSAVFRSWHFDPSNDRDAKIFLLIAAKDSLYRFNVTKALWDDLPDAKLNEAGSLMSDAFAQEKYGEGLSKCIDAIIATLRERHRAEQLVGRERRERVS